MSPSGDPNSARVARGRVLGIDAGERRIGVALSDELRLLASPLTVLDRRKGLAPVLDTLLDLAQRQDVTHVIVGLPLNEDGSHGRQAKRAAEFGRIAERVLNLPVTLWDERLSTQEAEAIVREQRRSTRKVRERGQMDAVAAAVILQGFLDAQRQGG
jgi:putative Holliday junction resolvase